MSTQTISTSRQQKLIGDFARLVQHRKTRAQQCRGEFERRDRQYQSQHEQVVRQLTQEYEEEKARMEVEYAEALGFVEDVYRVESETAERKHKKLIAAADEEAEQEIARAKQAWAAEQQEAMQEFDEVKYKPRQRFQEFESSLEVHRTALDNLERQAVKIVRSRRCKPDAETGSSRKWVTEVPNSLEGYHASLELAKQALVTLAGQSSGKFIQDHWPYLIAIFAWLVSIYPCGQTIGWSHWYAWLPFSCLCGALPGIVAFWLVFPTARRQTLATFREFAAAIADARQSLHSALETKREETDQQTREFVRAKDYRVSQAKQEFSSRTKQIDESLRRQLHRAKLEYPQEKKHAEQKRNAKLRELSQRFPPLFDQLKDEFEAEIRRLDEELRRELIDSDQLYRRQRDQLQQQWENGLAEFQSAVREMNEYCALWFPAWETTDWKRWTPHDQEPVALRFGQYRAKFEPPEQANQAAQAEPPALSDEYLLPAVLSSPDQPSLLLKAEGAGRELAVAAMQNAMLRMLTSLPPGKIRFTIIDPTGLGQNFSAFMHLADFDERLVSNRIWTESSHISQRLVDLTEHMENVIQKYLRNEYQSIQQYNQQAGEVAEAFQILVVANFPANFTDEAARRLASIANSGARCGVYTLISTDSKMRLPRSFDLADLEKHSATLQWDGAWFRWQEEALKDFPLELDQPPADEVFTEVVKAAGRLAKDSNRVEVPFAIVAAAEERWWSSDSRAEIEVPLGRVGATKLQYLRLGKGTSQHVLISGKTGSGKSTLLHALITNLSIHYSPDEIQFYLIDFKKGVEFKPYANHALPHARVVAIESEREFGLSVLERLDLELKQRGDLFRMHGVQDVKRFRDANPQAILPRVLLVIDEFQELFVKDDRIAQEATLLLDRLVRQGRAFGIHVLLGSQTLAGAYSLARSTLGQMAVRVALQCSEGDAHLILSEDNTAARLLSRPGEAIYNDANGMFEGNHPFQVVWLPGDEQERYLRQINQLSRSARRRDPRPIVFEGNVPANPRENQALVELLEGTPPATAPLAPRAWLGSAVAIKDPTEARFRRQSGANLLIVGQHDEMALGILANSLVSLAGELTEETAKAGGGARFYVLDGTRPDAPEAGFWPRFAKQLALPIRVVTARTLSPAMLELAQELDRRMEQSDDTAAPVFVLAHNLARFRDLRKGDDDFGFSSLGEDDKPESVEKQFARLLREGPAYGLHSIIWCDTYNNVNRWFDRQMLRDLEMRVLFQMGANDSSNLMDSPAASQLGMHRAFLYSEEHGQAEKFRPYGLPSQEWIEWLAERFGQRFAQTPSA